MEIRKAVIAGVAGGIAYVITSTIAILLIHAVLRALFSPDLLRSMQNLSLYKPIALHPTLTWTIALYAGYIILAIPCGFIYAALQKNFPAKTIVIKGLSAGLVAWYLETVLRMFWEYMAIADSNVFIVTEIIMQLAAFAVAGIVVAIVYEKVK